MYILSFPLVLVVCSAPPGFVVFYFDCISLSVFFCWLYSLILLLYFLLSDYCLLAQLGLVINCPFFARWGKVSQFLFFIAVFEPFCNSLFVCVLVFLSLSLTLAAHCLFVSWQTAADCRLDRPCGCLAWHTELRAIDNVCMYKFNWIYYLHAYTCTQTHTLTYAHTMLPTLAFLTASTHEIEKTYVRLCTEANKQM